MSYTTIKKLQLWDRKLLKIILLPLLFILSENAIAQTTTETDTTKPYRKYEVADTTDSIDPELLSKTIVHHEKIVAKYPDEPFIPNIMFELAESYASKAAYEFKQAMKKYDRDIKKFDNGEIIIEPVLPRISYKETIEICYKLFEKFPTILFKDRILYRLAISHLDEGNQEKAKEYFQRLLFETPESNKISESHFRLGEYYFLKREFRKAIEQYNYLLQAWDDPYFNMALYKLGWAHYNISDYSNAISTYIYLISDITLLETLNTELLGKTKADVKNESIEYISHSLTEYGGPSSAKKLLNSPETQSYAIDIFLKMGDIYKKRNFYPEAILTYETLIELFPLYPEAPLIQKEIIQCYEQDMEEEKAIKSKDTFVKKYGPNSQWLSHYPEGKVRTDAITLSQEMLFSLGTYYQAKAQEKKRKREYMLAIEKYEDYIKKFRDSKDIAKVTYYLADCYYSINNFDQAADEYFKVMTIYDDNEFKEDAAHNRILAYYELLKGGQQSSDSVTFYLEDFLGAGGEGSPIKVGCDSQADLLKACNDFVKHLPDSKNILEVLMKYAETLYELKKWNLAAKTYEKALTKQEETNPFYGQAINMIAQCYFKLGEYQVSENWFAKLSQVFPDSTKYIKKARTMISTSNFKIAENLRDQGKLTKAAVKFLKIAFTTPDPEIARAAIVEAANQFEKSGDLIKAVKAYERMIEEQPEISFMDELLIKAGLLHEKNEKYLRASDQYLKLVKICPDSKYAPPACLNAANCFEQLKLWSKSKQIYNLYIKTFATADPDEYIETLYKLGELSLKIKDQKSALKEFAYTIKEFKSLKRRKIQAEEYFPAKAQYMIAEINFANYKRIKLVPPLNVAFKKKQTLFQQVLKNYIEACNFKVADWTTASLYKTGLTYEEFANAMLSAPVPENLSSNEKQIYSSKINSEAIKIKQNALKYYKANVTNSSKNNIQNEWTENSKQKMEQLIVELGLSSKFDNSQRTKKTTIVPTSQIKGN